MAQKASGSVSPHKHCRVCGISISAGKDYCSTECKELDDTAEEKMKTYRKLTIGMMLMAVGVLVVLTIFFRLHG